MKILMKGAISATLLSLSVISIAEASLVGRLPTTAGGTDYQAVYDTDLNVTWLADANFALMNQFGLTLSTQEVDDTANTVGSTGRMTWGNAEVWVAGMNASDGGNGYLGFNDWYLPASDTSCGGYNCTDSELGHLFYTEFGASAFSAILGGTNTEALALFDNIQSHVYWSGTENTPNFNFAWAFYTGDGFQSSSNKNSNYSAWAVRSGDVSAVPIPAAVWLFGSGLLGLIGWSKRKQG